MKRKKVLSALIISIMVSLLSLTTMAYAGPSISLEKDVPRTDTLASPSTLTFHIYDSETGPTPVASQTFPAGEWSADL